jgi:hypothetical protein
MVSTGFHEKSAATQLEKINGVIAQALTAATIVE